MDFGTFEEFKKEVNRQRKTKEWYGETGTVAGKTVYIKGHGTWLQRYIVDGLTSAGCSPRTVKEFNNDLAEPFNN